MGRQNQLKELSELSDSATYRPPFSACQPPAIAPIKNALKTQLLSKILPSFSNPFPTFSNFFPKLFRKRIKREKAIFAFFFYLILQ